MSGSIYGRARVYKDEDGLWKVSLTTESAFSGLMTWGTLHFDDWASAVRHALVLVGLR